MMSVNPNSSNEIALITSMCLCFLRGGDGAAEMSHVTCLTSCPSIMFTTGVFTAAFGVSVLVGNHHQDYQHSHLDLTALTPKLGKNGAPPQSEPLKTPTDPH